VTPEGTGSCRPSDAKKRRLVPEPMEDLPEATVAEIIATIDAPPNMVGPEVCEINSFSSKSSKNRLYTVHTTCLPTSQDFCQHFKC